MTTPGTQGTQVDEIADSEQVKVIGERLKGLEGLLGPAGLADFLRGIGRGGIDAITGIGGGIVDLIDKATAKAAEVISGGKNIPPSNTKNRNSGLPADLSPIGGGMPRYEPYPKPVNGKCGLGFTPFDLNGDGEPDICIPSVFPPKDEEGDDEQSPSGEDDKPPPTNDSPPPSVPNPIPGDDKKEEKPEDTGGNNQGEDDTDLPGPGPGTGDGGGDGDKGGTPKPDANGVCPPGYFGRDTNGDGINDVCIPIGTGILDLLRMGVGMAGSGPSGRSETELDKAAEKAGLQVFNDPVNFMRYSPSALQMQDPRYYGITSFVPKGEEPDFNLGYRGVPGQMYANYNVDDKTGALSPRNARNGGIISLAEGSETNFPRKNGQMSGPGTERSDDIPAMLSDGEFVVNAKAVRGIGRLFNGKIKDKKNARREGARAMYALQRAGEKAAGLS